MTLTTESEELLLSVNNTTFGKYVTRLVDYNLATFIYFTVDDDWNIVIEECSSLNSKWEELSGFLGLRHSLIDSIKRNNPNNTFGCLNNAFKEWIMQNYNTEKFDKPSWRSLLTAVAKVDKLLFKTLAEKHQGVL